MLNPQAIQSVQQYLAQFAAKDDFEETIESIFGTEIDRVRLVTIRQQWLAGDVSIIPPIEIRPRAEINSADGAFAVATGKIYLAQELIDSNNFAKVVSVLLEEYGHSIDARLNAVDTPGDEGEIFSALVRGETLTGFQLNALKTEDDSAVVTMDGTKVAIEQAANDIKFDIVAKTGGGFQSLGDNPSINDRGIVAFIGTTLSDVDLYTGNPGGTLTDVTGPLRSANNTTRSVQINNLDQIVTQEFRLNAAFSAITAIRVWDANNPGNFRNVAANVSSTFQLLSQPSINNKVTAGKDDSFINNVVFSARQGTSGLLRTPQVLPNPNIVNSGVYNEEVLPTPVRPMISDDDVVGGVVVRFGNTTSSPIFLYKKDLSSFETIANVGMGFTNLGQSPGISDDGQVVTFYGDLSAAGATTLGLNPGAGIFASINTTTGRKIERIAGVSGNGFRDPGETFTDANGNEVFDTGETDLGSFTSFVKDSRVGTNYNLLAGKGLGTITYLTLDASGKEGLYTSLLSTVVSGTPSFSVKAPTLVTKVGNTIPGMDGTVQNLEIYDPINQAGQIAFWASFSDGKSAVIRANPPAPKVVNIATHGFGNGVLPNFLDGWFTLGNKLEGIANGSSLEGQVKSYISNWDSSSGWVKAFAYIAVSVVAPTDFLKDLATRSAVLNLNRAGRLAENAARTIVNDVISSRLLGDPQLSITGDQIIHLVGHSRGGAVNARVATLLAAKGYKIKQYTTLDGYSTDWPGLSGILGDISIVGEVNAVKNLGKLERAVNYRVQDNLFSAPIIFDLIKTGLGSDFNLQNQQTLREAFLDVKAPPRPAFENILLEAPVNFPLTDHLNITDYYTYSDIRSNPDYILDDYNYVTSPQLPSQRMFRSLSNDSLSRLSSDTVSTFAEAAISDSNNNYGDFTDGTFEELGSLQQQIASTIFPVIDDAAVQNWIAQIQDPAQLVSSLWDVSGNVKLVREGSNTLIELNQTNDTSLGQLLNLSDNPKSLEFDLSISAVGADDKIQVVFNGNILQEFVLGSLPANGRYSVSLSGLEFQSGKLTFRLIGPTNAPSTVRLDNLSVLDVMSANENPVADNDKTLNILEDSAATLLNIAAPTDPNGDLLTISINTIPNASKGEVRLNNSTTVTTASTLTIEQLSGLVFVPIANANGTAGTFSYTVSDGKGGTDSQTVTLDITPVNDAPVAQANKSITIVENAATTPLSIAAPTDVDGDALTLAITTLPDLIKGKVQLANGTDLTANQPLTISDLTGLTFVPTSNANGAAGTFSYSVNDGNGGTAAQIVTLDITPNGVTLNGTPQADKLFGTGGNEIIFGFAGNDTLYGDAGNDTIFGGMGVDLLFGGTGNDVFGFNNPNEGIDKINDFEVGIDLVGISRAGFGGASVFGSDSLVGGALDPSRFTLGTSATTASQRFIYNAQSGALFFDADGVGGATQVRVTQLVGNPNLTNTSFVVI